MARGRRPTRNRMDLRAQGEAAERRESEEEELEEEETDEDEESDEDEDEESDEEADEEESGSDEEDEDEEAPKKKKKKAKPEKPARVSKPRSRSAKIVRQRVVWGVFDNSHKCVKEFDYPRRADADAHAKQLSEDKKTTYFVQPVKKEIDEKKE